MLSLKTLNTTALTGFAAIATTLLAGNAAAAVLDFSDPAVGGQALWQTSHTYADAAGSGVDVTVSAPFGVLSYRHNNGIGVFGSGDAISTWDEINADQELTISFSSPVDVVSIQLSDIYSLQHGGAEKGQWEVTNASGNVVGNFAGTSTWSHGNTGELSVNVGELASLLSLTSTNTHFTHLRGFALKALEFNATTDVPELSAAGAGAAFALVLGFALIGTDRRRPAIQVTGS